MSCDTKPTLDRRITIETPTDSKDTTGAPTLSWATHKQVAANVKWLTGGESEMVTKVTANTKVRFIIRYSSDLNLDHKMRISFDSDYYNITAILEDQWNKYLTIKAELIE